LLTAALAWRYVAAQRDRRRARTSAAAAVTGKGASHA
jgi:hypothetical protein